MPQQVCTNTFGVAKWIVSPTASDGTHTTISAALTSAVSGDTIFIRPGTYSENVTLKSGVSLSAFNCDAFTPNVTISGTCTMTAAGTVCLAGIRLQTNSSFALAVTGTVASIVTLNSCYLNCLNNTGISFTSSSAASAINLYNCYGNTGTTGIAYWAHSSAGNIQARDCFFFNSGASIIANTVSAGNIDFYGCEINLPITESGTGVVAMGLTSIDTSAVNVTALTLNGASGGIIYKGYFASGSASAISVGVATKTIHSIIVNSSNTNAITGIGTINYADITYINSVVNNVTTQNGGTIQGSRNTAPSAAFLGEQIRATRAGGAQLSLVTSTAASLASISLTAGVWDISAIVTFSAQSTTSTTSLVCSISSTNNALGGTPGDTDVFLNFQVAILGFSTSVVNPALRVVLSATTTYFLVAQATFTANTTTAYGRISATRVG